MKQEADSFRDQWFTELYDLLLESDVYSEVIGETTKFLYTALKIDLLDTLSEVPDIFLYTTDLVKIKIPNHITAINDYSFAFNDNLKEVILPSNLTLLGVSCFMGSSEVNYLTTKVVGLQYSLSCLL